MLLKIDLVYEWIQPIIIAWCIHFKAIPNKKSLVIFKSHGKFTNILPRAVIYGDQEGFLLKIGLIVRAPVSYKFFIALWISRSSGG